MIKDYAGEKGAFLFRWTGIKWYDSYEEIQAIQDFIDWCEGDDIEVDGKIVQAAEYYRFVRIGEEMEDVEERGDGMWGEICVNRSIEF